LAAARNVDDVPRFICSVVVVLTLVAVGQADAAERAVVRTGDDADAVHVGKRRVWVGASGERVISRASWNQRRDAVAFAIRADTGTTSLVVVLVGGDADRHTMRWAVPAPARPVRRASPTITWMGRRRVAYGPSELRPTVVASWQVRVASRK
jgi:hypothetical protein